MTNQYHQHHADIDAEQSFPQSILLPLDQIIIDVEIQQRDQKIDQDIVGEYAENMSDKSTFPPVEVFGDEYILADGFHRVEAAKKAGLAEITAYIKEGNRRDAILHAVGSNATHGVRRTRADKRKAVKTILSDEEWKTWTDRKIAQHVGVSPTTVGNIRSELNHSSVQTGQIVDESEKNPVRITRKVERNTNGKKQVYEQVVSNRPNYQKSIDPEKAIENWKTAFIGLQKFTWSTHDGFEIGKRCLSGLKKAVKRVAGKEATSLLKEFDALCSELKRRVPESGDVVTETSGTE